MSYKSLNHHIQSPFNFNHVKSQISYCFSMGFPMVFLWFSYVFLCFPMLFLCFPVLSYGFPMVFLWFSYGFPMFSCGFPTVFLCFPMVSYGFPMVFLWVFLCFLCFPMVFLWFSYVFLCFPMAFPCFPMVSTWFPGSPGPSLPLHRDQRRRASRSEHRAAENGRWASNIEVSEAFDMGISWFNTGYWLLALLVFKLDRILYFFIYKNYLCIVYTYIIYI